MRAQDFERKWNELKDKVKQKWGRLTDQDISEVNGNFDQLSHKIQKRYGWDKEQADEEVATWCISCEKRDRRKKESHWWEHQQTPAEDIYKKEQDQWSESDEKKEEGIDKGPKNKEKKRKAS